MAFILVILLCTPLCILVSNGSCAGENDGKYDIFLGKKQEERNIQIVKRSSSRVNEIGGRNDNGIVESTTETNNIQYLTPGPGVTHKDSVKLVTTRATGIDNQEVPSSDSSYSELKNRSLLMSNENVTAESNMNQQVNDSGSTDNSVNNFVNKRPNSAAISESAIFSSNNSGAILNEHALSTTLNQSKNDTSDNFVTPVTETRKIASKLSVSANPAAHKIIGNNLKTTPVNQANRVHNDNLQFTTHATNPVVQTTLKLDSINSTTLQTTVQTKNEKTAVTNSSTTTQTKIESQSNQSVQFVSGSSNRDQPGSSSNKDMILSTADPLNKAFTESGGSVPKSSNKTQISAPPKTIPEAKPGSQNFDYRASEESIPQNEMSTEPEFKNNTLSIFSESEPESHAEPVAQHEKTNGRSALSTETIKTRTVNTSSSVVPEAIETTGRYMTKQDSGQTTKLPDKTTNIPEDMRNSSENESVKNSSHEQVQEPGSTVTNANSATSNAMASITSEQKKSTTEYTTVLEKSGTTEAISQLEKTSTDPSSTKVSSIATNPIISSTEPEDKVTAEPVGNITHEIDDENVTISYPKPVAENTMDTVTATFIQTVSKMPRVSPEPSSKSNHTVYPEPTKSETTSMNKTVERLNVSENYSATKSTSYPFEETTDETNYGNETEVQPESEDEDPDPETEQEPERNAELDSEQDAFAEPGPDWKLAKAMWKEAWEFHVYFFGISFALLGIYCLLTLIRLWNMEHLISKNYFISLQLLVIVVCFLRTTYLMVDAYNSLGTFPFGMDYFLYSIAFPCLTALFSILFYALLLATRVQVISKQIQKLQVLVFIIGFHFILSIVTDIVVGLFASASVMIFICQAFFILWGFFMFVGYLVIFRKLYKGAINRKRTLMGSQYEQKNNVAHPSSKQKYTLGLAVKVTIISAFFGIAIAGFELYAMFGVYGILRSNTKPDPWPWWTYHTIVRSLEVFMCLTIAYVASQPLRYRMKKNLDHKIYQFLLPCYICCCPDRLEQIEIYDSSVSLDYVISETDHLSWLKKMRNKKTASPEAPYPPHTAEKYADPDATLLVRKVKRSGRPSMLVVEDGFVRIRREDEIPPSNQCELDSGSSHSSDTNVRPDVRSTRAITSVINLNYTDEATPNNEFGNMTGVNFDNYMIQGKVINKPYRNDEESDEETDIDIVVTESEHEEDNHKSPERERSVFSNKSVDIFRPLSMIDLATSMESELDRAFNSSCVEEADLISHNSLPMSFDSYNTDWNDCAYNERLCDKYPNSREEGNASYLDSTQYSSDSADDQSKSSAVHLLRPPVRRCKSDDSKSSSPKYKHFEKNKYFSLSDVDSIGKDAEANTHLGSNGELQTEL